MLNFKKIFNKKNSSEEMEQLWFDVKCMEIKQHFGKTHFRTIYGKALLMLYLDQENKNHGHSVRLAFDGKDIIGYGLKTHKLYICKV